MQTDLTLRRPREDEEAEFLRAHRATSPEYPSFLHYYKEGMPFLRYLEVLEEQEQGINLPTPEHVRSTFLFAFAGTTIVGRASIRHSLNASLEREGGHIGYVVVPEFRRQGYATRMLGLALRIARDKCRDTRFLVTCDDENIASIRTIEKNGGVLNDVISGPDLDKPLRRYWIHRGSTVTHSTAERAVACFQGIATGDAIGKQTETLSYEDVLRWYPQGITGFEGTPGDVIPRYTGNRKRAWRIGETTDDTERTLAVARAIVRDRRVSHAGVGREMLACTKCVHPGIRSLWEFHQAGDAERIARAHDGCGAAARVAPVGIFHASASLDQIVNDAREASISTHGGPLAIAAAAATAAAVSAALDGAAADRVLELAEQAAAQAERHWAIGTGTVFARAVRDVYELLASLPLMGAAEVAVCCFPNRPLTIVPLALALATLMRSAEDAILLAANVGGDSDSVAAIAGGILGAMYPDTVNQHWCGIVEHVNDHGLAPMARELAALRH